MDIKRRFEALSKSAHLDVSLPKPTDFDASAIIKDGQPDELARIPARRHLFFDEEASILAVLKTSLDEDAARELLPSLELVLVAHATDAVPQGSGNAASASGKHDLCSASFAGNSCADIVAHDDLTYIVWKPTLHLSRPRTRLQRPAIYFTASLRIHSDAQGGSRRYQSEILRSYEPLPANVLEPLQSDPALRDSRVYLPESRIIKVAPRAPGLQEAVKPIRGASKRAFPAVPAIFSKVRYSALPDATLASLHLETSQVIAGTVTVSKVNVNVPHAQVHHLTDVALPLITQAGDETVILYKLDPFDKTKTTIPAESTPVSISIEAEASLDQGSRIKLHISWQTQVDLTQATSKAAYRWSRPLSTSSGHHRGHSSQSNPDRLPFNDDQPHSGESGIIFNFEGPAVAQRGTEFVLEVQCRNNSSRTRRFALLMLHSRKPKATFVTQASKNDTDLIASIFNAPPLEQGNSLSVLDLNPDVRVGPLSPGACFETSMKFRAMRTGVLDLGILRVIDLDTMQVFDVKELPDVVSIDHDDPQD